MRMRAPCALRGTAKLAKVNQLIRFSKRLGCIQLLLLYTTFEGVQSNNLNVHEGGPMQRPRSRLADSAVLSDDSFTLAPPDSFTLAPPLLQTFARGAVADGAPDNAGNISRHDANGIAKFSGALDRAASPAVTSAVQPDGSFTLTTALLNTLPGGALRDGS